MITLKYNSLYLQKSQNKHKFLETQGNELTTWIFKLNIDSNCYLTLNVNGNQFQPRYPIYHRLVKFYQESVRSHGQTACRTYK